jgi:cysteine desulfurase
MNVRVERKRDCQDGLHFELFHALDDDAAERAIGHALGEDALRSEERWGPVRTRTRVVPFQLEARLGDRAGRVSVVFRIGTSRDTRACWLDRLVEALSTETLTATETETESETKSETETESVTVTATETATETETDTCARTNATATTERTFRPERTTKSSRPAYFDHAASTPCDPRVAAHLASALQLEGHADATHAHGRVAHARLEAAAETIALAVGGGEVIWTPSASAANALATTLATRAVTTHASHPSITEVLPPATTFAPLRRDGLVDLDALDALLATNEPTLLTVPHACSVTGVLQPLDALAARLPPHVVLHVDAAQSFTRDEAALAHPRVDAITLSAHKIGGAIGIGALVLRHPETHARVLRRPRGTPAVALAEAFALATELARAEAGERRAACLAIRADLARELAPFGVADVSDAPTLAHVRCVRFVGLDARAVQLALAPAMSVSLGSACRAASPEPSEVLLAMGLSRTEAREAVRFSWSHRSIVPSLRAIATALTRARSGPLHDLTRPRA